MNVEYYVRSNGECPAKEFINSLPLKCQAKAFRSIMLLEEYGYELRMPFSRFIYDGIYELRSVVSSDRFRMLYFFR